MTRGPAVLAAALALSVPAAAAAVESSVALTVDGRPVDRAGGVAVRKSGVIYADIVDLTKAFDGVLTFQGQAVVVSINGVTARFTRGSRTALIAQGAVMMPGQTFRRKGDLYVPLETFVTRVANARLRVNPEGTHADILVSAGPSS